MNRRARRANKTGLRLAGSASPPGGPPDDPKGPTQAELALIHAVSADVRVAFPHLSVEDSVHFAAQAVRESRAMTDGVVNVVLAAKRGDPQAGMFGIDVNKHTTSLIDVGKQDEVRTVATFVGPLSQDPATPEMQRIGYAMARALAGSVTGRALLYAAGFRIRVFNTPR